MSLTAAGLTKRYGRLTALERVSLSVRDGEVLGLIGPNGAGKTTLFECLAGLLPADAGTVSVNGALVDVSERGRHLFYLPDAICSLAGTDCQVGAGLLAETSSAASARAETRSSSGWISSAILNVPIGTLSKGQRKRAVLAIGLLTPQPILLVDEPFDGLDLKQGREMAATLRAHAAGGRTLFLSIHQIHDAARICDRFVLLSGGHVRGEGTLDELSDLASRRGGSRTSDLEEVFLALT